MDKSVEATRQKFGIRAHRAREPGAARPHQRRLLRRPDAAAAARDDLAPEARLLTVQPYDKSSIKAIEKAILESDVGLTPNNDGNLIRLAIPELTEERRKELVKVVRSIAEEGRVAIRNIRRDVHARPARAARVGRGGRDEEHRAENDLQKVTDDKIAELDGLLKVKESEILEV